MADKINLRKFVAPEIVFGRGARKQAGLYSKRYSARKVLIVSDEGVKKTGWLRDIERSLEKSSIPYCSFTDISPNPREKQVMTGAEIYERESCDVIISVGGGSPMDCAKGIGIVATNGGHILDYEGVDQIPVPVPPMIFIPTTAGTSADVSQFAIITDTKREVKIAIVSKSIVPDIALVDPMTLGTVDPYLAACTGIDALVHAIEAYVSTGSGPLTDLYALDAVSLIWENLASLIQDAENADLQCKVMQASMEAGLAFSNAILGAVHAMAHSLGGMLDLPHGECNAMLLEHVVDFNFSSAPERYAEIARRMSLEISSLSHEKIKEKLIEKIRFLKNSVGIRETLGAKGVKLEDIPALAEKALKDACLLTNPRKALAKDLETIFKKAM